MKRADSLLAPLIKNLKIEDAVRLGRIRDAWQGIFEKPVSFHIFPANLKEGELLVNVDSPAWLQQLSFYKEDITKKLRSFGVRSVRLRLGRVFVEDKRKEIIHKKSKALTDDERSFIKETLSSLNDVELKGSIKNAMEKSMESSLKQVKKGWQDNPGR